MSMCARDRGYPTGSRCTNRPSVGWYMAEAGAAAHSIRRAARRKGRK
jgi:hypothetical protein